MILDVGTADHGNGVPFLGSFLGAFLGSWLGSWLRPPGLATALVLGLSGCNEGDELSAPTLPLGEYDEERKRCILDGETYERNEVVPAEGTCQVCREGGVFEYPTPTMLHGGDLVLESQAQVWEEACREAVHGDLVVAGPVVDLSPLNRLRTIHGDFRMVDSAAGPFGYGAVLSADVEILGGLTLHRNPRLEQVPMHLDANVLGPVRIEDNPRLTGADLTFLYTCLGCHGVYLEDTDGVVYGDLIIRGNDTLRWIETGYLDEVRGSVIIEGNASLTKLDGDYDLSIAMVAGDFIVRNNPSADVSGLMERLPAHVGGEVVVCGNAGQAACP